MRFSLVAVIAVLASGIAATALPGLEAHKGSERRDIFDPQPDPPGKEKENLKRALKVINEGDDTDEDDVPQGPDFPDEDGGDVIVRKVNKAKRALKVSADGDIVDADDTDGGPDNVSSPPPPPPDSVEREEKRSALKEARGVPPTASLPDIIFDTIPLDVIEPDIPLDVPDADIDDPPIEV